MNTNRKTAHARRNRINIVATLLAVAAVGTGGLGAAATANATCATPSCASPVAPAQPTSSARPTGSVNDLHFSKLQDSSSPTLFGPGPVKK